MKPASVRVELGQKAYDVLIGTGLLARLGELTRSTLGAKAARAFVVADAGLNADTVTLAEDSLASAGLEPTVVILEPNEQRKSLKTLGELLEAITATAHERNEPVIALGGGIVGDTAGLTAALYRRGVPVIQCPTTLLAMVDASVGGKTAINLGTGPSGTLRKNMAGVFHQPSLVIADLVALDTLPDREFRCGLAESVKQAMLSADWQDPDLFEWLEGCADRIIARDAPTIAELVRRNVAIKARVVASDEREQADTGGRALLNLGHTFAHALEPIHTLSPTEDPADAPLMHGEAVALGLCAACSLSESVGIMGGDDHQRVRRLLGRIGLATDLSGMPDSSVLVAAMGHDKKVAGGRVRLVLPMAIGRCQTSDSTPISEIARAIESIARA